VRRLLPLLATFAALAAGPTVACGADGAGGQGGGGPAGGPKPEPEPPFGTALPGEGCTAGSDCSPGLFCLPILPAGGDSVFRGRRCAPGCTEDAHCDGGRVCFQTQPPAQESPCTSDEACDGLPDPSYCVYAEGSEVGTCRAFGFCGVKRGLEEACNSAELTFCSATGKDLVCYPGPSPDGRCRLRCTPGDAASCGEGQFCAGLFEDPTTGICVVPSPDDRCDLVSTFCGERELCVAADESSSEPGRCFRTCDPGAPFCPTALSCTTPLSDERGICTEAGETNQPCDPPAFVFCKGTDVCVDESAAGMGTTCRKACSGPDADPECPAEAPYCEHLLEGGSYVCLEYRAQ
jgi:hypothetical protein